MEHFSSNGCLILQHIILFSMLREDPNSDIFCAIWESTLAETAQCYPYVTDRCFQKLLSSTWYIKWMIWNTLAAMAAFPCNASPYFWCWDSTPNLTFCVQFESRRHLQKWHNVRYKNKLLVYAVRSSSNLHHLFKESYAPLQQQWISLLAVQHPISCVEKVPLIHYFVCNLRVNFDRNGTG